MQGAAKLALLCGLAAWMGCNRPASRASETAPGGSSDATTDADSGASNTLTETGTSSETTGSTESAGATDFTATGLETTDTTGGGCAANEECGPEEVCVDATCVVADASVRYDVVVEQWSYPSCAMSGSWRLGFGDTLETGYSDAFSNGCFTLLKGSDYSLLAEPWMRSEPLHDLLISFEESETGRCCTDPYMTTALAVWSEIEPGSGGIPTAAVLHDGTLTVPVGLGSLTLSFIPVSTE